MREEATPAASSARAALALAASAPAPARRLQQQGREAVSALAAQAPQAPHLHAHATSAGARRQLGPRAPGSGAGGEATTPPQQPHKPARRFPPTLSTVKQPYSPREHAAAAGALRHLILLRVQSHKAGCGRDGH